MPARPQGCPLACMGPDTAMSVLQSRRREGQGLLARLPARLWCSSLWRSSLQRLLPTWRCAMALITPHTVGTVVERDQAPNGAGLAMDYRAW